MPWLKNRKNGFKICIFDKKAVSLHRELMWVYARVPHEYPPKQKNEYETTRQIHVFVGSYVCYGCM